MENPDEVLGKIREEITKSPTNRFDEIIEEEAGKSYAIFGEMEFVGAFHKEGRIKVLVRLVDSEFHEDVIEDAFKMFKEEIKKRITSISPEVDADNLDIYLFDPMDSVDIDEVCEEYKL